MISIGGLVLEPVSSGTSNVNCQNNLLPLKIGEVSQVVLVAKNPPASAGDIRDLGSIPGLGGFPGEGNGNPL